jgi:cytosine deaminase
VSRQSKFRLAARPEIRKLYGSISASSPGRSQSGPGLRGGIPIGSVLVCDGKIIGRGHNQRVQKGSVIHHGEMNCLENAGRQRASVYRRCVLYTTLSPCPMCSGAILLYAIPRVVAGENKTFMGAEEHLRASGVKVEVLQNAECIQLMRDFIAKNPQLWNEDIGV